MMQRTCWIGLAGALAAVGACAWSQRAQVVRCTFRDGLDGWVAAPQPAAVPIELSLTEGPPASRALRARYRVEPRKVAGIVRNVAGAVGSGLRVRLKTDTPTSLVIGCIERDGSSYMHIAQTAAGVWKRVEVLFATMTLSDDSKDENGRLDLDQIGAVVIADAAGFMPIAAASRTMWVDDFEFGVAIAPNAVQPYTPLLAQGRPSPTGARATAGVSYVAGKHGKALLADAPGELATVRVTNPRRFPTWKWEQGSIEMWLRPTRPLSSVPDFSGIVAMQQEPFIVGHRGCLSLFVAQGSQIVFMLNGSTDLLAASGPLGWPPGRWRHVAATWGPAGMRVYVDGVPRGRSTYAGGPSLPTADLVVGGHAWTIVSHRPSRMAIDDLRVSVRQRTEAEIAAAARSRNPVTADAATLAIERFDGEPSPPSILSGGTAPWNSFASGARVPLTISPAAERASRVVVRTAGGRLVRIVGASAGGTRAALGAFTEPGFYRATITPSGATSWFRIVRAGRRADFPIAGASACYAEAQENEDFFRYAGAAGVRMLRMPFEWYEIEPAEGRFVWAKYDRIVQWAKKYNVGLIPTFIWEKAQPAWAGPGEAQSGFDSRRYPPTDLAKWKRFVRAVVARYKGSVHWWIPANEPNLPRYWHPKPDPEAYVALLKATWEAAREADPSARLLGLSASGTDLAFMEACFKAGALRYCDAVGIHPYICPHDPDERIPVNILDPSSPAGTFRDALQRARDLIRRYGGRHLLWLDEAGQPYRNDFIAPNWGRPEREAAAILAKEMIEALTSAAVERVLWFSFYGGEYGSFAIVRPDGSPTLPLAAYCAVGDMLAGARYAADGSRGPGLVSRVFRAGSRRIEVVWRPSGSGTMTLRSAETAYDMFGFAIAPSGTARSVAVGMEPVYVVGR